MRNGFLFSRVFASWAENVRSVLWQTIDKIDTWTGREEEMSQCRIIIAARTECYVRNM